VAHAVTFAGVRYTMLDVAELGESADGNLRQTRVIGSTRRASRHCSAVSAGHGTTCPVNVSCFMLLNVVHKLASVYYL